MTDYSGYETIKVEKADKVATITLNRPEILNAINETLHTELENVFEDVARDLEINAIVLTGAGRAFCAGGDASWLKDRVSDPSLKYRMDPLLRMVTARRIIQNMINLEKPIIAAVNGDAVGLGANIALFCDVVIMSETARIGEGHVRMGLVAGDSGCVIWPLLVGISKAKEILMLGDLISAQEAERLRLVSKVVPPDQVYPTALDMARRLANGASKAIRWTKLSINKWLNHQMNLIFDASIALESLSSGSEDNREAVSAFIEKRTPQFKGY
ncbi:Short-chain-enoyl-CoA hydratase [subsurface metagenome]